jgi:hypothetical protein
MQSKARVHQAACSFSAGREAFSDKALGRSGPRFTYDEISEATNNFSKEALLGAGAFGKVYLATMADGGQLAVKHLKDGAKVRFYDVRVLGF